MSGLVERSEGDAKRVETNLKDAENYLEDEIDLRKYFLLVARHWRFIRDVVVVVVLATLLFGLFSAASAPRYEATAGVALVKSKTAVTFEDQIKTISPDTLAVAAQDASTRRSTLASLVRSPLVAQEVIKTLGDRLPANLQDPEALVSMVEGQVRKGTDVVDVIVRGDDRSLVTNIANAWAVAYESYVNRIYSGNGVSLGSIQQDVTAAKSNYEAAREALLEYYQQDRTYELQSSIESRKGVIETLQKTRQDAIKTILDKQAEVQTDFMGKYQAAALDMEGLPLIKAVDAKIDHLTSLYANKLKIEQTLQDARTLRDQVSKNPAGADSNSLALLLIKAQLATGGGLPAGLQLQVGTPSSGAGGPAGQVSDLDALISTLGNRANEIQADIDLQVGELKRGGVAEVQELNGIASSTNPLAAQVQKMAADLLELQGMQGLLADVDADKGSPLTETMDKLTVEVRRLEADLARERYSRIEATQYYTLTWQAYSTLQNKAQEMEIASRLPGSEVAFVSPAIRPLEFGTASRFTQLLKPLLVATALALLIGVAGALAIGFIWPESQKAGIPWRSLGGRGRAVIGTVWRSVFRRPATNNTEA